MFETDGPGTFLLLFFFCLWCHPASRGQIRALEAAKNLKLHFEGQAKGAFVEWAGAREVGRMMSINEFEKKGRGGGEGGAEH